MGRAYFARRPRTLEDLRRPYSIEQARPFHISREITLAPIDYENFITDLRADRRFLEDNAGLCEAGAVMRCLLVRQEGRAEGILVVTDPEDECFVEWGAYMDG